MFKISTQIVENTEEATEDWGYSFGAYPYVITRGDIGALLDGKCLVLRIDGEPVAFVYMNPEEVIKNGCSE